MAAIVPSSAYRGFLDPGNGAPFEYDQPPLGWDDGFWDGPIPISGQDLDNFMQQIVAGVTGLDPTLVRPRWQQEPPNLPDVGTTWAAVGVSRTTPLGIPAAQELTTPNGNGSSLQQWHEEFELLCSFYGPNAQRAATGLRSGMFVANNREALFLAGMAFVDTGPLMRLPSLTQNLFLGRWDITLRLRRQVYDLYPVLYFLSAPVSVITDTGVISNRG